MTIDLTKNTAAFGLMSEEEREALRALPRHTLQVYTGEGWSDCPDPAWVKCAAYRQRPTPPLIVDPQLWKMLPPWAEWIAGDPDEEIFYYEWEPTAHPELACWESSGRSRELGEDWQAIIFADPDRWQEAIVKRPEGV